MDAAAPETRRDPVVETLHGHDVEDPYRWLEADDDAVTAWVDDQNEYTDTLLDTPTADALRPRLAAYAEAAEYGVIVPRGGRFFQRVEAPEQDHAELTVREGLDSDRRTLVDPNGWEEARSLNWFVPGPDGERVAYGVDEGGTEQYDIHVLEVGEAAADDREREVLRDVGRVNPDTFAWTTDGFYYVTTGGMGEGQLEKAVSHHTLGEAPDDDRLVTDDVPKRAWPSLTTDSETDALVVAIGELAAATDLYALDDDELVPVLTDHDAEFTVHIHDGTVYLETDHDADRGRVLACPLETFRAGDLSPADCREVVPEREGVLQSVTFTADALVAHHHRDAASRLSVYTPDTGERRHDIALPEYSSVLEPTGDGDSEAVFYRVEWFDRPHRIVRAEATTGATRALEGPDIDVPDLTVERLWADSTDGATVPVFVVHRTDIDPDGDAPTKLYGYGGFRIGQPPSFDRFRLPFLAAGGVYAQVCARGGDEFGEAWHRAGSREHKQHTFDDFIAAAERLCETHTRPERLAVTGGSNGGLSVGAVITQRPDLFAAAVCAVPLFDMLRFHRFLLGESWTPEYGSPEDPEAFEWLRAYSPYQNSTEQAYPATMFVTAAGDSRVHPAHARKGAARLQANQTGDAPICLRTRSETGHGVGKPTSMVVTEQVEQYTFLADRLGLDVA